MLDALQNLVVMIAHEAGHAVVADTASPGILTLQHICFSPKEEKGTCLALTPEPAGSDAICLDIASFYLGGAAGETVAFGGFDSLSPHDLAEATAFARLACQHASLRRRPNNRGLFLRKMPSHVPRECWAFLENAYDLAVARIQQRQSAHVRLRDLFTAGYFRGQMEYGPEELTACLRAEA